MRSPTVRNVRIVVAAIVGGVFVSCARDAVPPTLPRLDANLANALSGGASQATSGFYLLPPLAPNQNYSGVPDGTLSPRVSICEWSSAAQQCGTIVAEFTTATGPGGERVRYQGQHYAVNWKTDQCSNGPCSLDRQKLYRLRVHVGAAELGATNIVVVANASALKDVNAGEAIGVVDGRTLPVEFRIEQGAVSVLPPGGSVTVGPAGALITSADGKYSLDIPAGALASNVSIGATEVASPPEGPLGVSPAIDFSPDGTIFDAPVTVTLRYDPAHVPQGIPASDLAIFWLDDGSWAHVPGSVVNEADHTISATTTHFTVYRSGIMARNAAMESTPRTIIVGHQTSLTAAFRFCTPYRPCEPVPNTWVTWESWAPNVAAPDSLRTRTDSRGLSTNSVTGLAPGITGVRAALGGEKTIYLNLTVEEPPLVGPQSVCGHKITGIAFDGTYYYVGEGHDGLLQCLSRFDAATGYYVDHRQILLDHRGLHWIPSLNRLTSRTWGGPIFSVEYSSGNPVQLASNPTVSRPGDEQSQPAVDADGVSYWILTAGRAERRRLSDHSLLKSFPVTSSAGYNVIAASDQFVFTLDGLGINGYSKNSGAFAGRQPLPHAHPCDGGIGLGVSANADRFMYLSDCRRVAVVPTTVQFVESVWSQAADMLTPRWGMATVAVGGKIYAIGGNASPQQPYPGGPVVSTLEVYDSNTDTWSTLAPLPVPLEHMMAAAYGGRIYVFGGWMCNLCGDNRMWAYNIAGNTWTAGPPPPFFLNGGTASVINDKIYITTGSCCRSPSRGLLMYDPGQGTYTVLTSSPRPHDFAAGTGVIDGKLYVAGGESSYGSLDVYDPATNQWSTAASMPAWRQHGAGVVVNGRLLIFGGSTVGPASWDDVYAYDPATNTWASVATSPTIRDLPSAALVNGVVYVLGGASAVSPSAPIGRVDRFHPY